MKMKMTKKGLIAGVISVSLLMGAGTVYAATNPDFGAKLQGWYNAAFGAEQADLYNESVTHANGKKAEGEQYVLDSLQRVNDDIATSQTDQVDAAKSAINGAKQDYMNQLNEKRNEIRDGMQTQFDALYNTAIGIVNTEANKAKKDAETELQTRAGEQGSAALTQLEIEINAIKDQAVADLQTHFDGVSNELLTQLDTMGTQTTTNIKNSVDAKYNEVKAYLDGKVQEFIDAQKALIKAEQEKLTQEALDALADVETTNN